MGEQGTQRRRTQRRRGLEAVSATDRSSAFSKSIASTKNTKEEERKRKGKGSEDKEGNATAGTKKRQSERRAGWLAGWLVVVVVVLVVVLFRWY